jgi:hypothetical protein
LTQIEAGNLKAFAVASPQRSTLVPDIPTMEEAGLPGAMFAPAKTPQSIVNRLSREIKQASTHPKFHRGARSAGHADRRLVTRRIGRGVSRRFEEMKRCSCGDRNDDPLNRQVPSGYHNGAAVDCDRLAGHVGGVVTE